MQIFTPNSSSRPVIFHSQPVVGTPFCPEGSSNLSSWLLPSTVVFRDLWLDRWPWIMNHCFHRCLKVYCVFFFSQSSCNWVCFRNKVAYGSLLLICQRSHPSLRMVGQVSGVRLCAHPLCIRLFVCAHAGKKDGSDRGLIFQPLCFETGPWNPPTWMDYLASDN